MCKYSFFWTFILSSIFLNNEYDSQILGKYYTYLKILKINLFKNILDYSKINNT